MGQKNDEYGFDIMVENIKNRVASLQKLFW